MVQVQELELIRHNIIFEVAFIITHGHFTCEISKVQWPNNKQYHFFHKHNKWHNNEQVMENVIGKLTLHNNACKRRKGIIAWFMWWCLVGILGCYNIWLTEYVLFTSLIIIIVFSSRFKKRKLNKQWVMWLNTSKLRWFRLFFSCKEKEEMGCAY